MNGDEDPRVVPAPVPDEASRRSQGAPPPRRGGAVDRVAETTPAAPALGGPWERPPRSSARRQPIALVVDDEPSVRAVVAGHLIRLGWAVPALPSAERALEWLAEAADDERPALDVSDVDMPGLTGVHLAAILRRDHPTLGVLLLSGRAAPGLTLLRLPTVPGLPAPDGGAPGDGAPPGTEVTTDGKTDRETAVTGYERAGAPVWLLGKPYEVRALGEAVERTVFHHWGAPRADASS